MNSILIFVNIFVNFLLCKGEGGFNIGDFLPTCEEEWTKSEECCTPRPPEDFKNCVTQKRRSLPVSSFGFKSISCQCHASPVTTEVPSHTKWVQTFRQCLLTHEEHKEHAPVSSGTDLFKACEDDNLLAVQTIVSANPERINVRDKNNRTLLMVAAKFGKTDVFNYLACYDCNWNMFHDKFNNSLLHSACIGGSLEIVKRLMSLRLFNLESKGAWGKTALALAVRHGHTEVAELLYQSGCNIMALDPRERNLLHEACRSKNVTVLKYVMAKGIFSLESRDIDGKTPLLMAAKKGFLEGCKYLIEYGVDVNAVDNLTDSVVHMVIRARGKTARVELMAYLLSIPYINKDAKGNNGQTPLLLATLKGCLRIFKLLVKEGCNTTAVDEDGNTILHLAAIHTKHDLVMYIESKDYISPSARGAQGKTALMVTAQYGYRNVFHRALKRCGDITALDDNKDNVLHWACHGGYTDIIDLILKESILDIDAKNEEGLTPLMVAIKNNHIPAFKLMWRKGGSTTMTDKEENSILHLAVIQHSKEMVGLLIELDLAKLLMEYVNVKGKTPNEIALENGFMDIVDIFETISSIVVEDHSSGK